MLIDKPRAPFAARFETNLLLRLDQALGRAPEPLVSYRAAAASIDAQRQFLEPIGTQEAIVRTRAG